MPTNAEIAPGSRILILEDLPDRREIFLSKLKDCNLVVVVSSVVDAIAALSSFTFDCIFLDHDLDGRNGVPVDDPNCGTRVAEFIVAKGIDTMVIIQSLNPHGAQSIKKLLPHAILFPGVWNHLDLCE